MKAKEYRVKAPIGCVLALAVSLWADGGGGLPTCSPYYLHQFPSREFHLIELSVNGKIVDTISTDTLSGSVPQDSDAVKIHNVFPYFNAAEIAYDSAGVGDSIASFVLQNIGYGGSVDFTKSP
jgi:hypothetical protein